MNLKPLLSENQASKPLVIAGPCSVETPEQLDRTVAGLVEAGIKIIRGGVWKPRTRPGSFEGVGDIALSWIVEVKKRHDVKFAVEVASARHVEQALGHGIDVLWIGARSTVNPFTVQEIADSLNGVDIPVLVKNPVNADIGLWIGALERINKAGIERLAAIHRGFSNFNEKLYRNSPMWQIPIELKTRFPELPIINDPSHISGQRHLVPGIAQMALDLNFDGLMIESHVDSDAAWSDAAQQLTPGDLSTLLRSLHLRSGFSPNPKFASQLELLREKVDDIDRQLLETLSRRMHLVEQAGEYKKENNVAIFQLERWREIFESRPEWAKSLKLDPAFAREIFQLIHAQSIDVQERILGKMD
jgi:chorismate mutase